MQIQATKSRNSSPSLQDTIHLLADKLPCVLTIGAFHEQFVVFSVDMTHVRGHGQANSRLIKRPAGRRTADPSTAPQCGVAGNNFGFTCRATRVLLANRGGQFFDKSRVLSLSAFRIACAQGSALRSVLQTASALAIASGITKIPWRS